MVAEDIFYDAMRAYRLRKKYCYEGKMYNDGTYILYKKRNCWTWCEQVRLLRIVKLVPPRRRKAWLNEA